jgi:hypothetical protein
MRVTTPAMTVSPRMHMATPTVTMTSAAMLCEGVRWQH